MARMTIARGALALVAVATAGCWPQQGAGPARAFHNASETVLTAAVVDDLELAWTAPVDLSAVSGGRAFGTVAAAPHVEVVALDAGTGTELWAQRLSPPEAMSSHITAEPTVVGDELWTSWSGSVPDPRGWACVGNLVQQGVATGAVVGAGGGDRYASHIVPFGDRVALEEFPISPACNDTTELGVRVVVAETDVPVWTGTSRGASPIVVDGQLIQNGPNGSVEAYAAVGCGTATCAPVWTNPGWAMPLFGGPDDQLFGLAYDAATDDDRLIAIDRSTGATAWTAALTRDQVPGIAIAGGMVYVSSGDDLLVFDADGCGTPTCSPAWRAQLSGLTSANPIVAAGVVYTGGQNGTIGAFDADGCGARRCPALAQYTRPGPISGLIVSGGRLYVDSQGATAAFVPA